MFGKLATWRGGVGWESKHSSICSMFGYEVCYLMFISLLLHPCEYSFGSR